MTDPTRTVYWIASYPKSGNTWVRFLVCNLVFGPQHSAAALSNLAPDIHELGTLPELPATPVFMKTHFQFSPAMPLATRTAAAIYVVRDPADVMLSNFHYSRRSRATAAEERVALEQYVDRYLGARGDPRWRDLRMGTWDEHVRSWLNARHTFPVLPLRYEELLADPGQSAQRICAFIGISRASVDIERAVAGASFQCMREIEEADIRARKVGIFYKPYLQQSINAGFRFMRAGRAGEARQALTSEQRQRVSATFGALMRELGYEPHSDLAP